MKFEFDELLDAGAREGLGIQLAEKVGRPLFTSPRYAGGMVLWLTFSLNEIHESTARGRYSDRQKDAREIIKKSKELQSLLSSFESTWGSTPLQPIFSLQAAVSNLDAIRSAFMSESDAAEYASKNMNGYTNFVGVKCADEFRRIFDEEPKISHDRLTQKYSGPFFHFVRFIFDRVELNYADASIYKAWKRKEKDKVPKNV